MAALWSEEAQFRTWLDVEIRVCEGWAKLGKIPAADLKTIQEKATFSMAAVVELEKETKHDLASFVSVVQKNIGPSGRFVHLGLTSSDVVDTAFAYRLTRSCDLLIEELNTCLETTRKNALRDKAHVMIGRTHGIHAEPTTMGLKWLLWHDMLRRSKTRLEIARGEVAVGKISGAVGTYAHLPPELEKMVCDSLGLKVDTLSTQVISRDRFAAYFVALAQLASVIETIAIELRHLQRTEVSEVREGFSSGQKGSSAMPHKRNPIGAENLTGISRVIRSFAIPALEDCALWHERDISHSSVERIIAPDASILADYAIHRLNGILSALEVFPEKMKENMESLRGVIYSQRVLLCLVEAGLSRDEAYEIVQKTCLEALDTRQSFLGVLKAHARVAKLLGKSELEALFQPGHYLKHIDFIYTKVLG